LAFATSVVALVDYRHHVIVIAADAKERIIRGSMNQTVELEPRSVCKILYQPSCAAGMAGYGSNATASFDLWDLINSACKQPGNLREKVHYFVKIAQPKVGDLIEFLTVSAIM